ncbi:hypothetical protein GCM10010869_60680 [Mesorhizobium tianshanense]|nr:hypothetical protein GCM10010869_60680 [Mesorhizobium tianshanense]
MGDIDDAHDAEHQRQAERSQRQHGGGDEAFKGGKEKMRSEGHSGSPYPLCGEGDREAVGWGEWGSDRRDPHPVSNAKLVCRPSPQRGG